MRNTHVRAMLIVGTILGLVVTSAEAGKVYWTERSAGKVSRANPDGTGIENLIVADPEHPSPVSLDFSTGKVYWADDSIRRANFNGSDVETVLTPAFPPEALAVDSVHGKVYWGRRDPSGAPGRIERADLDGSNIELVHVAFPPAANPTGLAIDSAAGQLYWSESGHSDVGPLILRANLDGTSVQTVVSQGMLPYRLDEPRGMALDVANGHVYWVDYDLEQIRRADMSGLNSNVQILYTAGSSSPNLRDIALDLAGGAMYWTDWQSGVQQVRRANLDGSGVTTVVANLGRPFGIDLEASSGKVYWADNLSNKIQRANLDGTTVEDVVAALTAEPLGVAVDTPGGKMYWTRLTPPSIQRGNLDGSGVEDLIMTGLDRPYGIALDLAGGKMYWTDAGSDKIQRANLDGSQIEDLVTTDLANAFGLTLDLINSKMYWTDIAPPSFPGQVMIRRAGLDGSNIETVLAAGALAPDTLGNLFGIAIDDVAGKIYWTDQGGFPMGSSGSIRRANVDGSSPETLLDAFQAVGIGLDSVNGKVYWTTNGGAIRSALLDGTGVETLISGLGGPSGIAVDEHCQLYGDVYPVATRSGDCLIDVDDIACAIGGFVVEGNCPSADIAPCTPNGVIDVDDIAAVLGSFMSFYGCEHPAPP